MSLDIAIDTSSIEEEKEIETSKTYKIDFENGRIIGYVDGQDAVKQFIHKALTTPRFKCLIYTSLYGSEIKERLIDDESTTEYLEADMQRMVEDALLYDGRVLKINNFEYVTYGEEGIKDCVSIKFLADTIFGTIKVQEVVL